MKLKYDPQSGAAYLRLRDRPVVETEEIAPGVLMDLAADGLPVGFDLLDAAAVLDDLPAATKPTTRSRPAKEKTARPA